MVKKINLDEILDDSVRAVMKMAIKARGTTQTDVAESLGMLQSGLSQNMRRDRVNTDFFRDVLNALDYEIVVVDRRTGEPAWRLETD